MRTTTAVHPGGFPFIWSGFRHNYRAVADAASSDYREKVHATVTAWCRPPRGIGQYGVNLPEVFDGQDRLPLAVTNLLAVMDAEPSVSGPDQHVAHGDI